MDVLNSLEAHWVWLALGLLLAVAEILIPGVFLLWMAGAAIITGIAAWFLPIGVPLQVVLFAVLAIAAVFIGRAWLRANPVVDADPKMNSRGARMVGEVVQVTTAIEHGRGRVRLGDGEWIAQGADASVGSYVRITGSDGTVLLVEPAD